MVPAGLDLIWTVEKVGFTANEKKKLELITPDNSSGRRVEN